MRTALGLVRGFEIRLSPDLPSRLRGGEPVTLGDSTAVLIDLPTSGWLYDLDEVLFNVQASGFRPVLAHPERYPTVQRRPGYGRELAERGVVIQVTFASFSGAFGWRPKKAAEALLREGAVHLVATDAHSAEHRLAAVPAGLRRLEALAGPEAVHHLAAASPDVLMRSDRTPNPLSPRRGARFLGTLFS